MTTEINFSLDVNIGRLIENGELTKVVKNPNYRGVSTPFWNSLKGVGDDSTLVSMELLIYWER